MTDGSPATPAGWYPIPTEPGRERYWDGGRWTAQTRSAVTQTPLDPGTLRQETSPYWVGQRANGHFWNGSQWVPEHGTNRSAAEREWRAQERVREAATRAAERAKAADQREQMRLHIEDRLDEVAALNEELDATVADLERLLASTLHWLHTIDFAALKKQPELPEWQYAHLETVEPAPISLPPSCPLSRLVWTSCSGGPSMTRRCRPPTRRISRPCRRTVSVRRIGSGGWRRPVPIGVRQLKRRKPRR